MSIEEALAAPTATLPLSWSWLRTVMEHSRLPYSKSFDAWISAWGIVCPWNVVSAPDPWNTPPEADEVELATAWLEKQKRRKTLNPGKTSEDWALLAKSEGCIVSHGAFVLAADRLDIPRKRIYPLDTLTPKHTARFGIGCTLPAR